MSKSPCRYRWESKSTLKPASSRDVSFGPSPRACARFLLQGSASLLFLVGAISIAQAAVINCSVGDSTSIEPFRSSMDNSGSLGCGASVLTPRTQSVTNIVSIPLSSFTSVQIPDVFTFTETTNASASGTLGSSHASVSITSTNTPKAYNYTSSFDATDENGHLIRDANGNTIPVHFSLSDPNPLGSNFAVFAGARVGFTDVITLVGPSPGAMISIHISAPLSASFSSSNCNVGRGLADNTFYVSNTVIVNGVTYADPSGLLGSAIEMSAGCPNPGEIGFLDATFQAKAGSKLFLEGGLRVTAALNGDYLRNFDETSFTATADASQTGKYVLDILTPGAYYVDESGLINPFASPLATTVAEPATLALFGIGLAGLGFSRRKRAAK